MPKIRSAFKSGRVRTRQSTPAKTPIRPRTVAENSTADEDTQHRRLLIGVAHHLDIGEPDCCLTALAVLSASRALRRALDWDLGTSERSECSFIALVTLYAVEPIACTPDALARDAEIDLETMRNALEFLEIQGWVSRECQEPQGRPKRVRITEAGIKITILAVQRFLEISAALTGGLGVEQRTAAIKACALIVRAVAAAQNERSKKELNP